MDINKITHGKKSEYHKEFKSLKTPMFYDGWKNIKLSDPPPNDSPKTKKEINILRKMILSNTESTLKQIEDEDRRKTPFELKFLNIVNQNNKKMRDWIYDLAAQLFTICIHFKDHYDRPRPFKLAKVLNIDYPEVGKETETGDTPSYPSGHAFNSYFLAQVLGDMFPKYKDKLFNYAGEVVLNRMRGGLHFPSDIEAGKTLAKRIYKYYKKPKDLNFKEWINL